MKNRVIAIGLDSADPDLLEKWMAEGHLPNLQQLIQDGSYGRVRNTVIHASQHTRTCSTERLWSMTWSGCRPDKTGFWDTSKFFPKDYSISRDEEEIGVNFAEEYPPFYAFLGDRRVAVFDPPASGLCDRVNGKQILGWGGHYPFTPSHSNPEHLLPELIEKHGKNDVLYNDDGFWGSPKYAKWLNGALNRSIETRTKICKELLQEEDWDLFVAAFPETHSSGHDLIHLSLSDHPLYSTYKQRSAPDNSPVLDTYKAVDKGVGEILKDVPDNTHVICFSVHGMGNNVTDALSMVALPEVMFRWNFPGKQALAPGTPGTPPPKGKTNPIRKSWQGEIWNLNYDPNPLRRLWRTWAPRKWQTSRLNGLVFTDILAKEGVSPCWMPTMWYSHMWPKMKAFSLPSFADGHIRINLKGRERDGIVLPEEYDAVCEELTELFYGLVDARTGETIVDQVVRTRHYPTEDNDVERLPGPDLVVLWKQNYPTDVVDSPQVGRVGPFPCPRPGGHKNDGFVIAKGAGIEAGSQSPDTQGIDIAPTILSLLGAPIPEHFDGKPMENVVSGQLEGVTA